jgi:hypothetical protein
MKITIKSGDEQAFTVAVLPSDRVIDLKRTIQSLKKFVVLFIKLPVLLISHAPFSIAVTKLRLFYWAKELKDEQTMKSCGIDDHSVLHMAVRQFDDIRVTVKVKDKSTPITVCLLSSDTGRSIKFHIQGAEGYAGHLIACSL